MNINDPWSHPPWWTTLYEMTQVDPLAYNGFFAEYQTMDFELRE